MTAYFRDSRVSTKLLYLLIQEECASISFMSELDFMANGDVALGRNMEGIAEDV